MTWLLTPVLLLVCLFVVALIERRHRHSTPAELIEALRHITPETRALLEQVRQHGITPTPSVTLSYSQVFHIFVNSRLVATIAAKAAALTEDEEAHLVVTRVRQHRAQVVKYFFVYSLPLPIRALLGVDLGSRDLQVIMWNYAEQVTFLFYFAEWADPQLGRSLEERV